MNVMQNPFKLDWKVQLLDKIISAAKTLEQMNRDELRELSEKPMPSVLERVFAGKLMALNEVTQQAIRGRHGDIPIRLYYPSTQANLPLVLFFH